MSDSSKKVLKLGPLGTGGKVWIESGYVSYRGMYGGHFKVRLADIQVVNVDMQGKAFSTKAMLRFVGGGEELAAVEMYRNLAEQTRDWIIENKTSNI